MSDGRTYITYNGVTLENVLTRTFDQESVYDDTGTDLLFHRFHIRVRGQVTGRTGQVVNVAPVSGDGDAGGHLTQVWALLNEPRGDFVMRMGVDSSGNGGTTILDVKGAGADEGTADVDNGPKPKVLGVHHIIANEVVAIEWECEVCRVVCDSPQNQSSVLSNRWSVADDIDPSEFTVRTWTGRLRVSKPSVSPNDFRDWVVPSLQDGMRRDAMRFTVTADGLNLDYTIVDREIAFAAPSPATKWEYHHTETALENGAILRGTMSIVLEGDRTANKFQLIQLADHILCHKLLNLQFHVQARGNARVERYEITDHVQDGRNYVSATMEVLHVPFDGNLHGLRLMIAGKLGQTIRGDEADIDFPDGYHYQKSRGSDAVRVSGPIPIATAFQVYLQTPCDDAHQIGGEDAPEYTRSFPPGLVEEAEGLPDLPNPGLPEVSVNVTARLPSESGLSDDQLANAYTHWQMESTYETDHHTLALPVAVEDTGSQSVATTSFVTLAPAQTRRVVRLRGERIDATPRIPDLRTSFTDENGITNVILSDKVRPATVERDVIGMAEIYRIAAEFVIGMSRTPTTSEQLRAGRNPWDILGVQTIEQVWDDEDA